MSTSDLGQVIEQYHRAVDAFLRGDPEPSKKLFSRRDDVTVANPLGPPVRGWSQVESIMDLAASQFRDSEPARFETISEYATADLAYNVELQRNRLKVGSSDDFGEVSLRVTTIFRREDGEWKVIHRHADQITAPRPIESVLQQ